MSIVLRDYQLEATNALWEAMLCGENGLCVLPTGSGKSVIIDDIIKKSIAVKSDIKIVILFNNVDLLKQLAERFRSSMGSSVGVFCTGAGERDLKTITVASIQSIENIDIDNINLVIIDEVHCYNSEEGRYFNFIKKYKEKNQRLRVLGFSATPFRSNGYIYGKNKLFERITYQKPLGWMIEKGYLVRPSAKKPSHQFDTNGLRTKMGDWDKKDVERLTSNEKKVRLQIQDALPKLTGCKKVIWFCSSIAHAEMVNNILKEQGESSMCIHSKLHRTVRDRVLNSFKSDYGVRHLTFVTIVKEGFDHPPIDAVCFMRPTKSALLAIQVAGRGLRPWMDKKICRILDYGHVFENIGTLDNPILNFTGGKKRKQIRMKPVKVCPKCYSYVDSSAKICPDCEHVFKNEIDISRLSIKADENITLLGEREITVEVKDVRIKKHVSKANNICVRIDYVTGIFTSVAEFFNFENEYGYKKLQKRLMQLDVKLKSTIEELEIEKINRKPTRITYVQKSYPNVKSLHFIENEARK